MLGGPENPPQPRLSCVEENSGDLLFTAIRTAKATWRDAWPKVRAREYPLSAIDFDKLFRSTIEYLDLGSQRVLARYDLNHWILACLPGNRVALYCETEDGDVYVQISQVRLVRR
jgi:hypothetical protein